MDATSGRARGRLADLLRGASRQGRDHGYAGAHVRSPVSGLTGSPRSRAPSHETDPQGLLARAAPPDNSSRAPVGARAMSDPLSLHRLAVGIWGTFFECLAGALDSLSNGSVKPVSGALQRRSAVTGIPPGLSPTSILIRARGSLSPPFLFAPNGHSRHFLSDRPLPSVILFACPKIQGRRGRADP
jgi:hypothetical protein